MKSIGSNEERRKALVDTIDARLREMKSFMAMGKPVGFLLPNTMLQFRQMNIPELGIFPISSPSTLNAKQNPRLGKKIEEIFRQLEEARSYVPGRIPKAPSLSEINRQQRRQLREQKLTIAGLSRSYHEREHELEKLVRELATANRKFAKITEELNDLRRVKGGGALRIVSREDD